MKSSSVRIDDFTLAVRWMGSHDPSAPVIVMLHGMMESSAVWTPIVGGLPTHWRYALLDLPWNGLQTGLWGGVRSPDAWLDAALVALGLRADAFVAHSFSASVLLDYLATRAPDDIRTKPSVLISPFYKQHTTAFSWPLLRRYVASFPQFVEDGVVVRSGGRRADPALLERIVETSCETFGVYNWMEFWRLFARMPAVNLVRLPQPILLSSGEDDFSSPPEDQYALLDALPHGSLELVSGAKHFLLDSHPGAVTGSITRFLSPLLLTEHSDCTAEQEPVAL